MKRIISSEHKTKPFLRWAGSKRWLVKRYSHCFPSSFNNYIEPFVGSGSVFFHINPKTAIIGDTNTQLITTYNTVKTDWKEVYNLLQIHHKKHNISPKEYYYYMRESAPSNDIEIAARFIYLNRTCFNGIYRVNVNGKFNVPKGSKNSVIMETDNFEQISKSLKNTLIVANDFEELIKKAKKGDLVFADPPYTIRHNQNGFVGYNKKLFSWEDQERLAKTLIKARSKGAQIILTNANHNSIRDLYPTDIFNTKVVSRYSAISAKSLSRKHYEEIIIKATD